MKKLVISLMLILLVTGCSVVRIDTESIDNTINVIKNDIDEWLKK